MILSAEVELGWNALKQETKMTILPLFSRLESFIFFVCEQIADILFVYRLLASTLIYTVMSNYLFKRHSWKIESHKSYKILNVYLKTRSNVVTRFIIESMLFYEHKDREGFIDEIVDKDAFISSEPCYDERLRFDVNKELYVRAEYYFEALKALLKAKKFKTRTSEFIKAIDHHSLLTYRSFDCDDDYLTKSTILIEYEEQKYLFKETEDLSSASFIYQEFQTLWCLNHSSIILSSKLLVKSEEDSNRVLEFLLQYYSHENLREFVFKLRSNNDVSSFFFCKWVVQLAQVFHHLLYMKRFFYQNIKLENCVVNEKKNLILIDFEHDSRCKSRFRASKIDKYHDIAALLNTTQEQTKVFSMKRTLWVVWEITSINKYLKKRENEEYCKTIFTENTASVSQSWKDMILQCVDENSDNRSSLTNIFEHFKKKSQSFKQKLRFNRDLYFLRERKWS